MPVSGDIRDSFMRVLVLCGLGVWISTESLGALHMLGRGPLLVFWAIVFWAIVFWAIFLAALFMTVRLPRPRLTRDPVIALCGTGIAVILLLTGITAAMSPPNSADAMAYHLPRVIYWAQQRSVDFFSTPYFNQIMLQPLAEYVMLQTHLLTGGDHFINFVQWGASLGSIVAVSCIARLLGAAPRAQAFAALFCATLPSGLLASSGAKNDYFLALWLAVAVCFALRFARRAQLTDAVLLGSALGLALLTKATGYLFIPCLLFAILHRRGNRQLLLALGITMAINAPHYAKNYQLSGSVMGFDSAQGDGVFRWRNETFGWRQTASNAMRNLADQTGARSAAWNARVYRAVAAAHTRLGIDLNDPATTWRGTVFEAPRNANHEANAPNRWHLAIIFAISALLFWRAIHGSDRERALYAVALACGFLAFCGYLKWQPFFSRLLLPLLVLAAPLAGMITEFFARRKYRTAFQLAVCLLLLDTARPAVLENWVRPLKGPHSVFNVPREEQYFADMSQWNNRASYTGAVAAMAALPCEVIGIDIANLTLEYPLQALLKKRKPQVQFVHTGVQNVSARYRPASEPPPCAVICPDCAGDQKRLALYSAFPVTQSFGTFVLFSGQTPMPRDRK